MKRIMYPLLPLLLSILLIQPLWSQTFEANLTGQQEAPPVTTMAGGEITAVLNGNQLTITGNFSNLGSDFNAAIGGGSHIHMAYAGENGPVQFSLVPVLDTDLRGGTYAAQANTFTLSPAQVDALMNRQMYINIHTIDYPGGEIRGQLLPAGNDYYGATLFGSGEVPAILSQASGALVLELDGNTLTVSGSFAALSAPVNTAIAGGMHLHSAFPGQNGSVEIPLNITLGANDTAGVLEADSNTYVLTAPQQQMLEDRMFYANVHTFNFPSGELRGQVVGLANVVFRANLSGTQEVPVVLSNGHGRVIAELHDTTLIVTGSFAGLGSDLNTAIAGGAHIHNAMAGSNGSVVTPISADVDTSDRAGVFEVTSNTYQLSPANAMAMLERSMYVNIHSMTYAGGELRGQLLPLANAYFVAPLTGMQEVPPVYTEATGTAIAEWRAGELTVSGSFAGLESDLNTAIAGGAHIHTARPGENGPVWNPLSVTVDSGNRGGVFMAADNQFATTTQEAFLIASRGTYVNVHSLDNASGEVRGQILGEARAYFTGLVSGASEPQPVNTLATGTVLGEWNGTALILSGSVSGLDSDVDTSIAGGAHLHNELSGRNGPVEHLVDLTFDTDLRSASIFPQDNLIVLADTGMNKLYDRSYYLNVHTQQNASGAIRGQLLPFAQQYYATSLSGWNEEGPVMSDGFGGLSLELNGDDLVVTGGFNQLESDFNTSVGGGAHLHLGEAGENGGVAIPINALVASGNRAGWFTAEDNAFTLNTAERNALTDAGLYANIHTMDNTAGELRGQVLPRINFFPEESDITTPAPGAVVQLPMDPTQPFMAEWTMADDSNGNKVIYRWELALDAAFTQPLGGWSTGTDAMITVTTGFVDTMLMMAGVQPGDTATLYHRAIASDGSLNNFGDAAMVNIVRSPVGVNGPESAPVITAYPVPANGQVFVRVDGMGSAYTVQLISPQGRAILPSAKTGSGSETVRIPLADLPAGMYFLRISNGEGEWNRPIMVH